MHVFPTHRFLQLSWLHVPHQPHEGSSYSSCKLLSPVSQHDSLSAISFSRSNASHWPGNTLAMRGQSLSMGAIITSFPGHYFLTLDLWVCVVARDRNSVTRWFMYRVLWVEREMTAPLLIFGVLRIWFKSHNCWCSWGLELMVSMGSCWIRAEVRAGGGLVLRHCGVQGQCQDFPTAKRTWGLKVWCPLDAEGSHLCFLLVGVLSARSRKSLESLHIHPGARSKSFSMKEGCVLVLGFPSLCFVPQTFESGHFPHP